MLDSFRKETGSVCESFLTSYVFYFLFFSQNYCFVCEQKLTFSSSLFLFENYRYVANIGLSIGMTVLIVVVNGVLRVLLTLLARSEHHHSEGAESSAISMKVFTATFMNTALTMLIVNRYNFFFSFVYYFGLFFLPHVNTL